jgi:hypothetical protein
VGIGLAITALPFFFVLASAIGLSQDNTTTYDEATKKFLDLLAKVPKVGPFIVASVDGVVGDRRAAAIFIASALIW